MSSKVIEELLNRRALFGKGERATVIYFFCSNNLNEPQWNTLKAILTSLLSQILLSNLHRADLIPVLQRSIPQLRDTESGKKHVTLEQVENALKAIISKIGRCW